MLEMLRIQTPVADEQRPFLRWSKIFNVTLREKSRTGSNPDAQKTVAKTIDGIGGDDPLKS